jgi:hypothetical protein
MYVLRKYAAHLPEYKASNLLLQQRSSLYLNLCILYEEVTNSYAELCRMLTHADVCTVCVMKCDSIFLGCLWNEMVFCIIVEDIDTKEYRKRGFLSLSSPCCHMRWNWCRGSEDTERYLCATYIYPRHVQKTLLSLSHFFFKGSSLYIQFYKQRYLITSLSTYQRYLSNLKFPCRYLVWIPSL